MAVRANEREVLQARLSNAAVGERRNVVTFDETLPQLAVAVREVEGANLAAELASLSKNLSLLLPHEHRIAFAQAMPAKAFPPLGCEERSTAASEVVVLGINR